MIAKSLRQAWHEAKQQPLFTSLYVAGVALAIAFTMIYAVVYYVKLAPIYPEYDRANTLYVRMMKMRSSDNSSASSLLSLSAVNDIYRNLDNVECVSAELAASPVMVTAPDNSEEFHTIAKFVDPEFFDIYSFRFVAGRRFTREEFDSGVKVVLVSDALARRLYGSAEKALGRDVTIDYLAHRIVGVVKEGSVLMPRSFGQIYAPYTSIPDYDRPNPRWPAIGLFQVTMTVRDRDEIDALHADIDESVRRVNMADTTFIVEPEDAVTHAMSWFVDAGEYNHDDADWLTILRNYILIIAVLLIVPSINLSAMINGNMDRRLSEMGIRKTFGAARGLLLAQVMWENLILTCLGGVIGLVVAWLVIYGYREWLFLLFDQSPSMPLEGIPTNVTGEMLFAPAVFVATFALCLVLNLLSALLPAWWSLRHPIVSSLNEKR